MVRRGEGRGAPHKPCENVPLEVPQGGVETLGLPQAICLTRQVQQILSKPFAGVEDSAFSGCLAADGRAESFGIVFCSCTRPNLSNRPQSFANGLSRIEHRGELWLRDAHRKGHRHRPPRGRRGALSWTQREHPQPFIQDHRGGTCAASTVWDDDGAGIFQMRVMFWISTTF